MNLKILAVLLLALLFVGCIQETPVQRPQATIEVSVLAGQVEKVGEKYLGYPVKMQLEKNTLWRSKL